MRAGAYPDPSTRLSRQQILEALELPENNKQEPVIGWYKCTQDNWTGIFDSDHRWHVSIHDKGTYWLIFERFFPTSQTIYKEEVNDKKT